MTMTMTMKCTGVLLSAACSCACSDANDKGAPVSERAEGIITMPNCETVEPANLRVTLATTQVQKSAVGSQYGSYFCDAFLYEVAVPGSLTLPEGYTRTLVPQGQGTVVGSGDSLPYAPYSPECHDYREWIGVWHEVATHGAWPFPENLSYGGGGTRRGVTRPGYLTSSGTWKPPRCVRAEDEGFDALVRPLVPGGHDFYAFRIAIRAYQASTGEHLPVVASVRRAPE